MFHTATKANASPTRNSVPQPVVRPGPVDSFAQLQRTIGNQAVLRMLRHSPLKVQPKLAVNQPGDEFEQEADRVAEQVVTTPAGEARLSTHSHPPAPVQMKTLATSAATPVAAPPIVHEGLRSPGHAPDAATRAFMEPRLGFDLSGVRVHTGRAAAESAGAISARAYTSGNDIVFGRGEYRPETTEGRKLLAHELTHVAQQRGAQVAVQRQPDDKAKRNSKWGTAPPIVKIEVDPKKTGTAWGYYPDGNSILIEILTNKLDSGTYIIRGGGRTYGPTDSDYVQRVNKSFVWRISAANFYPDDPVTVIVKSLPADRFTRLPEYIKNYLMGEVATGQSKMDLEALADEGEKLIREGITAADLALAADPRAMVEMEGKAPPDPDLVESLRRRGLSDFPSREEYYRRLAWELVNSSDYRRWWTNADIAAYWREFPEEASADWNKFADKRYIAAKKDEELAWLEAFRRIDAAAGVANAIALVTVFVAGGFAGAEIVALPAIEVPALPAAIQGVPTGVWAKTLFASTLSASFLSHVYSRSEEAVEAGETNPISIVSAAVDDTLVVGKLYESATNESLLTQKDLHMTPTERIVGGVTGTAELAMNYFGFKDLMGDPVPSVPRPKAPPTEPPPEPVPVTTPKVEQPVGAVAESAEAPVVAGEVASSKNDVIDFMKYKAAREAEAAEELVVVQEQQQAMEAARQEAQPRVAEMASGGSKTTGSTRTTTPRTTTTTTKSPSPRASKTVKQQTVFKRFEKPPGQKTPYDLEGAGAEINEAEDIYETMEAHKNPDPGRESNVIKGEFGAEDVRPPGPFNMHEYDPRVGDSRLLSFRMRRAGIKRPGKGYQAHHMIPGAEPEAKQVRDFLFDHGFKDINDPDNGVFLPTHKKFPNIEGEFKHEFTFDRADYGGEYFRRLEDIFMVEDITEEGIRLRLQMLAQALKNGRLPGADEFSGLPL
jgi:hypothetical protein